MLEGEEKQNQFWKTNFNIDKTLLNKKPSQSSKIGDVTNFILPEIIRINQSISLEELINLRIFLSEKYLSISNLKIDKFELTESLLGLGNNFNSLSNYLNKFYDYLLSNKITEIIEAYHQISNLNDDEKNKINQAIEYLSKKAQLLQKPKFIDKSWQEYRSIFGGKIQSWYSNYINRILKSNENYQKILNKIDSIITVINNYQTKENKKTADTISNKIIYLKDIMIKNPDIFQIPDRFDIFSDLLADLKTDLNLFYQKYIKKNEEDKINKDNRLKFLFEKIEKPINFYGQSKKERLKKIVELTAIRINDGLKIIKILLDEHKTLKTNDLKKSFFQLIESFFDKLAKKTIHSNFFYLQYKNIIKDYLSKDQDINKIFNNPQKYSFYKSEYEKRKLKIIKTIPISNESEIIMDFLKKVYQLLNSVDQNNLLKNPSLALEYLETAKTFISFSIENNNKTEYYLDTDLFKNFEKIINFIKVLKTNKLTNNEYNKILNQYFFSELKGDLTLASKKYYLSKYSLQVMNSDKEFPIIIKFKNHQLTQKQLQENPKIIINYPHQYLITLDQKSQYKKIRDNNESTNTFLIGKNDIYPIKDFSANNDLIYLISSSRYQIQFLDRLIYKPKNWLNIKINIREPSFILEIKNKINFDIINNKISTTEEDKKLYVSIPFEIKSTQNKSTSSHLNKLYLGIDAGEYGVAYSLVDFSDEKNPKIIESAYIKSKNIRKIRDYYQKIQEKAKKGVFLSSSDLVKKIRENSINEIRNQIHKIYLKHQSPIIYEYSISNFETGSGRITKIYDSIKKSDVPPDNDADKSVINHIWGKEYIKLGKNVSAYASSYTCSHCGRSLFSIIENINNNQIFITKRLNENGIKNIIEISTPEGKIYGYSNEKKYVEGYIFKNTNESKKELKKLIQSFARPPLDKSEVLFTFKKLNKKILKKIKSQRGNSAIFVCPFVDCLHVFDADLQASFIIAVRGYLKDKNPSNKNFNIFQDTLDYIKNINSFNYKIFEVQGLASLPDSKNQ